MGTCCGETRKSLKKDDAKLGMGQFRPKNYKIKVNGKDLDKDDKL